MLILLFLMLVVIIFPGLYSFFRLFQEHTSISASRATTFNLKGCALIFIADRTYAASDPYIEVEVPGKPASYYLNKSSNS